MKTNSAFVRADRIIILYSMPTIGADITLVIYPADTKMMTRSGSESLSNSSAF